MPTCGNNFTVTLGETHLKWGTYRHTNSRDLICNEMYIPIPAKYARAFGIYNSNYATGLGKNIFKCTSLDGLLDCMVKTTGCSKKGNIYAKNLEGNGNLKLLAPWVNHLQIKVGDSINVKWLSPNHIMLTHIPS